jgi:hypothetical protein
MRKQISIVLCIATIAIAKPGLHAMPAELLRLSITDTVPSDLKVMRTSYDHQKDVVTIELTLKDQTTGDVYKIEEVNNKVKRLYKNDVLLPEDQINQYGTVLQKLEAYKSLRNASAPVINSENTNAGKGEKAFTAKQPSTVTAVDAEDKIRSNPEINKILDELFAAGIITSKETVNFKLDYNGLTVNKKLQSETIHQKLKKQYLNKEGDYIELDLRPDSSFVSFNRN